MSFGGREEDVRNIKTQLLGFGVLCSLIGAPALAHHSFAAEFDRLKPVTFEGTITKIEWQNPHTRLYLTVRNQLGIVSQWELELASPNSLMRAGWTRHSVQIGDKITVKGFQAKDGNPLANAAQIFAADGRKILSEQSSADAPASN
jgi:hypothetical protein